MSYNPKVIIPISIIVKSITNLNEYERILQTSESMVYTGITAP